LLLSNLLVAENLLAFPHIDVIQQTPKPTTAHYATKFDFFGKHISGILTVKRIDSASQRMVFTTETGFKFFDFRIIQDSVEVLQCIEPMRKKGLLKLLTSDLNTLVFCRQENILKSALVMGFTVELLKTKSGKVKRISNIAQSEIQLLHKGLPVKYHFSLLPENEQQ